MSCIFPIPKEIPSEVKQKVMNHVFPQKGSLLKRASLIKVFSVSLSFFGIIVLFYFLYIKTYFNSSLDETPSFFDDNIVSKKEIVSPEISFSQQNMYSDIPTVAKEKDLDDLDLVILETENLLKELEGLI